MIREYNAPRRPLVPPSLEPDWRTLFDLSSDALLVLDPAGWILEANPAALELFTLPFEALAGRQLDSLLPPLAPPTATPISRVSPPGHRQMRRPGGEVRRIEYRLRLHFAPGRHLAILRDVTDAPQAHAGTQGGRIFRALFDHLFEAALIFDDSGQVLEANPAAGALHGSPPEALIGRPIFELLEGGEPDDPGHELLISPDERQPRGIYQFHSLQGARHDVEILALIDVLEGRHLVMMRQLSASHRTAPPPAATRPAATAPAAHPTGISATPDGPSTQPLSDLMLELERLREEWTTVVAHDLRQPITTIIAFANLLHRQTPPEDGLTRTRLQHIVNSGWRLNRMVSHLKDASLIDRGRLKLDLQPLEVGPVVAEAVERVRQSSPGRVVLLEIRDPLPEVALDIIRLEQMLTNLLGNALRYSYADSPIRVALFPAGEGIEITVQNDGAGIPPEEMGRLFTRFHRTAASRKTGLPGLGLGLFICHHLAEAHGGRLWAESLPGRTTTFHLSLPAIESPASGTDPAPATGPAPAGTP